MEQHVLIKFSVEIGQIPVGTKKLMDSSRCHPSVSGVLIKWHKRLSGCIVSKKITKELADPLLLMEGRWR